MSDYSDASASELAHLAKTAMERLTNKYEVLSAAERQALTMARVSAIGELARREEAAKAEAKSEYTRGRLDEIEREAGMHRAMISGAETPELGESERAVRQHRLDALANEAAMLQRSVVE